ncbi:MAG: hypothetical protein ACF8AM_10145 [Rhodopirellula sp. JB055]|uniref:hypothetical protein n=1 Tax=Rhodopirellula sp. JB055 TaxID=3342846 RepID=UPI00370CDF6A
MSNPYQPPESASENLSHDCPVCGGPVGYWRFAFPLGYCPHCRNYLAIRHWERFSWIWSAVFIGIIVIPIWLRANKYIDFTPPIGTMMLIWFVVLVVHGKFAGRLVPAYCWRFFATPDDDRIKTDDRWEDQATASRSDAAT